MRSTVRFIETIPILDNFRQLCKQKIVRIVVCGSMLSSCAWAPNFGEYDKELIGKYRIVRTNQFEVVICPDNGLHGDEVNGVVERYAVNDPYITGYAGQNHGTPSPDYVIGYFLIDTSKRKVQEGLTEEQWRQQLHKIGWENPKLEKPW
jgi:hypothetical protein